MNTARHFDYLPAIRAGRRKPGAENAHGLARGPFPLQGRTNGAMNTLEVDLVPIGAMLGGVLGQAIGMRETLFLASAGEIAAGLWILLSPVWTQRDLSETGDA